MTAAPASLPAVADQDLDILDPEDRALVQLSGRMSDDEIAIAECLVRMSDHVDGGPPFYSLAEASQDNYLALLMQEAARTGEPVRSRPQVWANA